MWQGVRFLLWQKLGTFISQGELGEVVENPGVKTRPSTSHHLEHQQKLQKTTKLTKSKTNPFGYCFLLGERLIISGRIISGQIISGVDYLWVDMWVDYFWRQIISGQVICGQFISGGRLSLEQTIFGLYYFQRQIISGRLPLEQINSRVEYFWSRLPLGQITSEVDYLWGSLSLGQTISGVQSPRGWGWRRVPTPEKLGQCEAEPGPLHGCRERRPVPSSGR